MDDDIAFQLNEFLKKILVIITEQWKNNKLSVGVISGLLNTLSLIFDNDSYFYLSRGIFFIFYFLFFYSFYLSFYWW